MVVIVEEDQSYFLNVVNQIDKNNFDKQLTNISPCSPDGTTLFP